MRLTPELFEQITGLKESSLEQLPGKDKNDLRAAPRVPLAFRSSACRVDGAKCDPPIQVQICDISVMGIGLTHATHDRLGKQFVVAIRPRGRGNPLAVHCEVTNFQVAGQTHVRVGAQFARLGSEDDLKHCLGLLPVISPAAPAKPAQPTVPAAPAGALKSTTPSPAVLPARDSDEIRRIRDAMLS